jgi:D-alanyl-D-alanine dipeptidase
MKLRCLYSVLTFFIFLTTFSQTKKTLLKNEIVLDTSFAAALDISKLRNSSFVDISQIDSTFVIDMPYATEFNFLKQKVYDCQSCYLRKKTAIALIKANNKFKELGYHIKIYDCYRPLDVQKKMWTIVSDPKYVANPATGSIHNRGGAIDITLVNANNIELDMGTKFDFFGEEASHDFLDLPVSVLENRKLLKKILKESGFESFDSEWWHYNLKGARKLPISNFKWNCN